jgi:hypothetical protein
MRAPNPVYGDRPRKPLEGILAALRELSEVRAGAEKGYVSTRPALTEENESGPRG